MSSLLCCFCSQQRRATPAYKDYALVGDSAHPSDSGAYRPPSLRKHSSQAEGVPTIRSFQLLKTLGRGGFSKVLQVRHKPTGNIYALKVVSKSVLKTEKEEERLLAESQILRRVEHPFCISLQFSFQTEKQLCYVFDFVPGGVLYHHLKQSKTFDEARARFYIGEIILALEYLHSLGIIFRDLKLENCLLSEKGHIRLTDFGTAKDIGDDGVTKTFCGTPTYIAPEVIRGEHYGQAVDWWTCGIMLYEMLIGKAPFQGANRHSIYKNVLKAPLKVPSMLSPAAQNLLSELLQRNPGRRLGGNVAHRGRSGEALKAHDFFATAAEISSLLASDEGRTVVKAHTPNTWTWEELEQVTVEAPWKPGLESEMDVKYFDVSVTVEPASLGDLPGERTSSKKNKHLDDFNFARSPSS